MTFRVKKWTYFCILLVLGIALSWGGYEIGKDKQGFFRFEYGENSLFEGVKKPLYYIDFPYSILFQTTSDKAVQVRAALIKQFRSLFLDFHTFSVLLDEINNLKVSETISISEKEYNFLKDTLGETNIPSEAKNNREVCSAQEISFTTCFQTFDQIFSIKENQEDSGYKNWIIVKHLNRSIKKDLNLFFELYSLKVFISLLKNLSVDKFVLHTTHLTLSQEKTSKDGWAVQWGISPKQLYYLNNQLIYTDDQGFSPKILVKQPIKFDDSDFSVAGFLDLYTLFLTRDGK